jgi:glycosyltransferase involved in cell wall biosynthesis
VCTEVFWANRRRIHIREFRLSGLKNVIAWQPVLTDHQAFTLQALARKMHSRSVAYVTSLEDAVRKDQGWSDTQVRGVERRLIPNLGFLGYCYQQLRAQRSDVHLFCSPFQQPRLILCMALASIMRIEFYLVSEPYSPEADGYLRESSILLGKIRSTLRPHIYRAYVLMLRGRLSGIFAISRMATEQYLRAGVPIDKLFPFGYFIPSHGGPVIRNGEAGYAAVHILRIVFVGSLIRRKGFDILIGAVRQLLAHGFKLELDLYGPATAAAVAEVSRDEERIRYKGMIPFGQAQSIVAGYDLLVLPSRYDGWGVVVNEALCAGVPVVCSDRAGAGVVAATLGAGLIFPSGDAGALERLLKQLLTQAGKLAILRDACGDAARVLQPEVAATYMASVIRAPASHKADIKPPWSR